MLFFLVHTTTNCCVSLLTSSDGACLMFRIIQQTKCIREHYLISGPTRWQTFVRHLYFLERINDKLVDRNFNAGKRNSKHTTSVDVFYHTLGLMLSLFQEVNVHHKLRRYLPNTLPRWVSVFNIISCLIRARAFGNCPISIPYFTDPFYGEQLSLCQLPRSLRSTHRFYQPA